MIKSAGKNDFFAVRGCMRKKKPVGFHESQEIGTFLYVVKSCPIWIILESIFQ